MTLLSILANDAIALPLSPAFPTGELKYIMDNSAAKVLVATEKYADKARNIVQAGLEREPILNVRGKIMTGANISEDVTLENYNQVPKGGMMLYTSGTTNRPVGVITDWPGLC